MREARYRFTDDVRAATRAIAARMVHAGEVAQSAEELDAWLARTDDLRETLTKAGYGSAFNAEDLFPLLESNVAKRTNAVAPRTEGGVPAKWLWIGVLVAVAIALAIGIAVVAR